uniref:Uncharacterized protein n=1 Tax=Anguilla anguilla TaxID=7936 RepID=A0A0E9TL91_ANGAN
MKKALTFKNVHIVTVYSLPVLFA